MDRPLTIGNVYNMSWESLSDKSDEYPHLVAQFPCETEGHECLHWHQYWAFKVCCAAVWFHDLHNVTVKGITMILPVEMSNEPITLVILKNVSGATVQLNVMCFSTDSESLGITIYEATSVEVHSSSANNCPYGLVLHNTTNTHIAKVTAMYNWVGIVLDMTTDTHINNTIAVNNVGSGIDLLSMNNTYITNMTLSHNGWHGMTQINMNNTHITSTTASHNGWDGLSSFNTSDTHITNMTTSQNCWHGMYLFNMNNTHITNTTTVYNHMSGMKLLTMSNTHVSNTAATHNSFTGIYYSNMNNTRITTTTVTRNGKITYPNSGTCCGQIVIISSTYTLIYHTSFTNVSAPSTATSADPTSLPAVIVLYNSTLHVSDCDFIRNHISAVRAHASNITVSGDVTFSSNRAFAGTAFVLMYDSILTSAKAATYISLTIMPLTLEECFTLAITICICLCIMIVETISQLVLVSSTQKEVDSKQGLHLLTIQQGREGTYCTEDKWPLVLMETGTV